MNTRTKNLAVAGGAAALLGIIAVNLLMGAAPAARTVPSPVEVPSLPSGDAAAPSPGVAATPATSASLPSPGASAGAPLPSATSTLEALDRRGYAIGLQDLRGFPPDVAPGTAFELWVTWEPPITEEPRLHKLIGDVVLERVIPGRVPEAPVTVVVSVPTERTADLIYADSFGRLNVVLPE